MTPEQRDHLEWMKEVKEATQSITHILQMMDKRLESIEQRLATLEAERS